MKIVMIDQDGVLLDGNYKTTMDIKGFLKGLPGDIEIVPNSDTPYSRVVDNFLAVAGFRPRTVIAEKGAVVFWRSRIRLVGLSNGIKRYLAQLRKLFAEVDCDVVSGDSSSWVRDGRVFCPNRRMLIIDSLRKKTVGFYLMSTGEDGVARRDNSWFKEGSRLVKQLPLPSGLVANDFNEAYGIVIMNAAGVSKTDGYRFLRKKHPLASFYMVGDSDADIILDDSVVHCAVANASIRLKKKAKFVSQKRVTAGLVECLQWIAVQNATL